MNRWTNSNKEEANDRKKLNSGMHGESNRNRIKCKERKEEDKIVKGTSESRPKKDKDNYVMQKQ